MSRKAKHTVAAELDPKAPLFQGFIRGMLPLYILMLLKNTSLHGTVIMKSIFEMSGHSWKPSPGSVYPVLRRLEKEGLIAGRWRRSQGAPQRVYRLTDAGHEAVPKLRTKLLAQLKQARELIDSHIEGLEQGMDHEAMHHGK